MKKSVMLICTAAALLLMLGACGEREIGSTLSPVPTESPEPDFTQTLAFFEELGEDYQPTGDGGIFPCDEDVLYPVGEYEIYDGRDIKLELLGFRDYYYSYDYTEAEAVGGPVLTFRVSNTTGETLRLKNNKPLVRLEAFLDGQWWRVRTNHDEDDPKTGVVYLEPGEKEIRISWSYAGTEEAFPPGKYRAVLVMDTVVPAEANVEGKAVIVEFDCTEKMIASRPEPQYPTAWEYFSSIDDDYTLDMEGDIQLGWGDRIKEIRPVQDYTPYTGSGLELEFQGFEWYVWGDSANKSAMAFFTRTNTTGKELQLGNDRDYLELEVLLDGQWWRVGRTSSKNAVFYYSVPQGESKAGTLFAVTHNRLPLPRGHYRVVWEIAGYGGANHQGFITKEFDYDGELGG